MIFKSILIANRSEIANRFAQIAERANLRAQIRTEQIIASMKLEMAPRVAGIAAVGLLVREEVASDETMMHRAMERLRIHCTGNYR